MAAWAHSNTMDWQDYGVYENYRKYVTAQAASLRGRQEDCADLSISLLIDFAAANGLALTFKDNNGRRYISKSEGVIGAGMRRIDPQPRTVYPVPDTQLTWSTREQFKKIVQQRINVEALWTSNTVVNPRGPEAGDLMLSYKEFLYWTRRHHAALIYRVYAVGQLHPKWNDTSVPDFPGPEKAEAQTNVTEYFRGTVDDEGATFYRTMDLDTHFDYLNHRGEAKPNAELIYYGNARQILDEDFEFRMYASHVMDSWYDWDGRGAPPR